MPEERETFTVLGEGIGCAELDRWHAMHGLIAGITTRSGPVGGFNLGLTTSDPSNSVTARWSALTKAVQGEFPGVVVSLQPHGAEVREHESSFEGWLVLHGYDGHVTGLAGILLAVTVADCVPVYLAHPPTGSIALLHAGWRGIASGILERGIDRLSEVVGAPPAEFVMHCGVAIGPDHYEVGPEVLERLGLQAGVGEAGEAGAAGAAGADLRGLAAARARAAGVEAITRSPWCTYRDSKHFWSHRRDPAAAGRMVAYLGRPLT